MAVTKWPRLLDAQLREKAVLRPSEMRLTLTLSPLSRAEMVLPAPPVPVTIGDWVEVYAPTERAGVFRVETVEEQPDEGVCTVSLTHGFGALADLVTPEETLLAAADEQGALSADRLLALLLESSGLWVLDRCDWTDRVSAELNSTNLLSAVLEVSAGLTDSRWLFDQTALPWRASLVRMDSVEAPSSEMRLTRNVERMRVTVDRSSMYTRVYPRGAGGLTIAEVNGGVPYLEENVDRWGLVAVTDLDAAETDPEQLLRKARAKLHRSAGPQVSVSVSGLELSQATDEALDRLTVGRVCRVPLPGWDRVVTERIVALTWPDVLNEPERVQVTMADRETPLSAYTGAAIRSQRETSYRADRTCLHRLNGIDLRVRSQEESMDVLGTRIVTNETSISQSAEAITLWAGKTTEYGGRLETAEAQLRVTAEAITLKASRIELEGAVRALEAEIDGLFASDVTVAGNLAAQDIACVRVDADGRVFGESLCTSGSCTVAGSITMGGNLVATQAWVEEKAVFDGRWAYCTFSDGAGVPVSGYFWIK